MMDDMVERVARALSVADGMHPDFVSNDEDEIPGWTLYVDDARAAIEAMRGTTKEMRLAMNPPNGPDYIVGDPDDVWSAAIDAALKRP